MNYHYFENGQQTPRGFVRIANVISQVGQYSYAPEIIGEKAVEDCDGLSRKITSSLEEAQREIVRWASCKGFRLEQID